MIFLASTAKLAELPTEVVGTMPPFSVIAVASTTAMSTGAIWPARSCSTVSDKCWSMNITSPALILRRRVGSDWNGMRRLITLASVSTLSMSLPSDAPVIRVIDSGSRAARSASAKGTALQSPARVKPLIPTVMPSANSAAAASGDMMRSRRRGRRIRSMGMAFSPFLYVVSRASAGASARLYARQAMHFMT